MTHYANIIAGAFYNNKSESSETPTRTGTLSVNCNVYTAGRTMTEPEKSSELGEISAVTVRLQVGQLPTDCSAGIFSHL